MSEAVLLWLFGAVFACIAGIFGMQWRHAVVCKNVSEKLTREIAVMQRDVTKIMTEIGNHDSGMICQLHRYSKAITRLCAKAGVQEP